MAAYQIKPYHQGLKPVWNTFIATAKNSSFLFNRDFMEYHRDRFDDFSLMVYEGEQVAAVFPANKRDKDVYSHQGLTYGGLILPKGIGLKKVKAMWEALLAYLTGEELNTLTIKLIPPFYHQEAAYEQEHLLVSKGAQLAHSALNFGIDYGQPLQFHKTKRKHFKKNQDSGFLIQEEGFSQFWKEVLVPRLQDKHDTEPVHTLTEIQLLHSKFPDNIKQINIYNGATLLAGITLFISDKVVKSQYGATTQAGERHRALDYLFMHVIQKYKEAGFQYFDMGTVHGGKGEPYNFGLIKQKEELATRAYIQHTLKLNL